METNPVLNRWQADARRDPEGFWAQAAEQVPWFRKWDQVFEWTPPTFRWFSGGQTNLCHSCLDYHVNAGSAGKAALIVEDERKSCRVLTYAQLLSEVKQAACSLRALGIRRGDRVAIYMPTCAEAIIVMLAATRIGAIHLVVFAGFGTRALTDRIGMCGPRILFTADAASRKGHDIPLKQIVDEALHSGGGTVETIVVLRRGTHDLPIQPGRDILWEEFLQRGRTCIADCELMESNEPAFLLATSGTTAKPKIAVHTHGGYQVFVVNMAKWVFGLRASDVWWSTSDIGWVVGHSYIVYAPLILGCTTIAYEGALDYPGPETVYRLLEKHRVSGLFTSPTAVRLLMRYGRQPSESYDLGCVERIFCAGEVLNPPVWEWFQKEIFHNRAPVIDHMWQTETGGPIIGIPYGLAMLPIKPGSSGVPLPGIDIGIVTPEGKECAPGEKGILVINRPFPGLIPSLWSEPERYRRDYWERIPDVYYTGDLVTRDEDGYVWFSGRAEEIIKIAGHRIGTIEIETALLRHPSVAEAGVTGRPDELRAEVISAFVVLKQGIPPSDELKGQLIDIVRCELGPIAVIGDLNFVRLLPKTRSGKIMRRVLRAIALNQDPGDISTIEDEASVVEAQDAFNQSRRASQS